MKRIFDTLWVVVLLIAAGAVGAGFFGGRSIGSSSMRKFSAAPFALPEAIVAPPFVRVLSGAHSLDLADPTDIAPVSDIVASRPAGWAPLYSPHLHEPSKLALVLVDCGREPKIERPFIESPIPLSIACDAKSDESPALVARAHTFGKPVFVEFDPQDAAGHETRATLERRYHAWNARGFVGTVDVEGRPGADALAAYLGAHHGFAVDTMAGSDAIFYQRARARHVPALTRDVVVDTRDERAYTAFMLQTAVRISRRTGVAVVVIHAKPRTYGELVKFAVSASRDNVRLVSLDALAR